jgi:hypothetical protein
LKRILFILFTGFCCLANAQFHITSSSKNSFPLTTKKLGTFYVTTVKQNNNGQKSEKCIINDNEVDCDLISKCNKGDCDELENYLIINKVLEISKSTNTQKKKKTNNTQGISGNQLYIKATTNKRKLYQGEQILVTYKLFTRVDLASTELVNNPALNGFWTQDIKVNSKFKREIIDGVAYNVATVKKALLTAQKSGELQIDPMEIRTQVRVQKKSNRRDPFDPFGMFNQYSAIEKTIRSKPIKIIVEPLPTPKPTHFYGAVGNIKMNAEVDKSTVKANEAINFKLTLYGSGNLALLKPFEIAFPPDFEVYDPKVIDKTFSANTHTAGKKIFEYLLIPRFEGNFEIPAITFTLFNPSTKKYQSIRTAKIPIQVLKGEQHESGTNIIINKEDVKLLNTDIRYIKTNSNLEQKSSIFFRSTLFWILFLSPMLLFLALIIYLIIAAKNDGNSILQKSRKATKIAQKRLKNAQKHLNLNEKELFFEDIEKSLWGYFADKFTVQIAQLSKESITHYFEKFNIKEGTQNQFISLLANCEMARYAPSAMENTKMQQMLKAAQEIIIEVEQQKR